MHAYATNYVDRVRMVYGLAVVAVTVFLVVGFAIEQSSLELPFWVGGLSAAGTFTALFGLYDRVLWRRRAFGLRLAQIPDLNGTYVGYVHIGSGLGREEGDPRVPCWVCIVQTWSRLSVQLETQYTTSRSSMAALDRPGKHPLLEGLRYAYHVEPKLGTAAETLTSHAGLARLLPLNKSWSVLDGDFFNDGRFNRVGHYQVKRLDQPIDVDQWLAEIEAQRSEK